jgi:hypothetical protein
MFTASPINKMIKLFIEFVGTMYMYFVSYFKGQGVSQGSCSNGLVAGRAYSVTGYAEVSCNCNV